MLANDTVTPPSPPKKRPELATVQNVLVTNHCSYYPNLPLQRGGKRSAWFLLYHIRVKKINNTILLSSSRSVSLLSAIDQESFRYTL